MIGFIKTALSCHRYMPLMMALIAITALGMALISQYVYGLTPCNLCIIQRVPYGIVIALGLIAFLLSCKYKKTSIIAMVLIGVSFLANSVIAFYHSGVERGWWRSFLEGCNVPSLEGDIDSIMEKIKNTTEAVRCDEIPWADPVLGLSMANYNVVFCFGLGVTAFISAYLMKRK